MDIFLKKGKLDLFPTDQFHKDSVPQQWCSKSSLKTATETSNLRYWICQDVNMGPGINYLQHLVVDALLVVFVPPKISSCYINEIIQKIYKHFVLKTKQFVRY